MSLNSAMERYENHKQMFLSTYLVLGSMVTYSPIEGTGWSLGTTNIWVNQFPLSGKFIKMRVQTSTNPGSAHAVSVTLQRNNVDTAMQVVLSDNDTVKECYIPTDFQANDLINLRITTDGGNSLYCMIALLFVNSA